MPYGESIVDIQEDCKAGEVSAPADNVVCFSLWVLICKLCLHPLSGPGTLRHIAAIPLDDKNNAVSAYRVHYDLLSEFPERTCRICSHHAISQLQ